MINRTVSDTFCLLSMIVPCTFPVQKNVQEFRNLAVLDGAKYDVKFPPSTDSRHLEKMTSIVRFWLYNSVPVSFRENVSYCFLSITRFSSLGHGPVVRDINMVF